MTWQEFLNSSKSREDIKERFKVLQYWDSLGLHPFTKQSFKTEFYIYKEGDFTEYTIRRWYQGVPYSKKNRWRRDTIIKNRQLLLSI